MWEYDVLLLSAAVLVAALVALRWYWSHVHCRFFTVMEQQIYRSGTLEPGSLQRRVQKHGIHSVIDFRSARGAVDDERAALSAIGVAHFHLPSKQTPRRETIEAFLELLDREENRPVLIHCNHGVRRAAQFEAICRMEYQRWTNRRALFTLRLRSGFTSFRPGSKGSEFVRAYVPRHARGATAAA